jgi:hypothetical protein
MFSHVQGLEDEANYVRIVGDTGMDVVASLQLNVNEMCQSITSTKLGDDPATYYVVSESNSKTPCFLLRGE